MKEFIEKLIGRLSDMFAESEDCVHKMCESKTDEECRMVTCEQCYVAEMNKIINELAEEYKSIINYNTLLNDIKSQLKQFIADSNNIDYNRALLEAIEVIDKKAEEHNSGWIPCSERLPEKDGNYLITFKGRVYEAYYQDGFWLDPIEFYRVYRSVTAWQPLPTPYNPKGE